MRRALFLMLSVLSAGCATGATRADDGGGDGRIVALSDPGARLPELGRSDVSAAPRAGGDAQPAPALLVPGLLATPKHLAGYAPFTIASCKKDAFCDDFEEPSPATRWTSTVTSSGIIDFPGPSSSLGAHALRATTTSDDGAAYLALDGSSLGAHWVGALGFAMRVDALPVRALGGPEIAVVDASGAMTRVGFSVRPEGIALHQYFESCSGSGCAARSDLVSDVKPGEWRHLVVAIETYGTSTSPFGRIEVTVDDGELIVLPLTVRPYDGQAKAHAGITAADLVLATARIDDVTFYAHSP